MASRGRSSVVQTCAWLSVVTLAACTDADGDAAQHADGDAEAALGVDGSGISVVGNDAGWTNTTPETLTVALSASAVSLCKGACTTLSAQVSGGSEPYTFGWSHGLAPQASQQVCPAETTHYRVEAYDSGNARSELFTPQHGSARVTIEVRACQPEAPPLVAGSTLCTMQLPITSLGATRPQLSASHTRALAADAQGNSYLAIDFAGSVRIGSSTWNSEPSAGAAQTRDVLLAKLDDKCGHVWSKRIGAASGSINVAAIASDEAGNIAIVGNAAGTLDFGGGPTSALGAFVAKYGSDGQLRWLRSYQMGAARSVTFDDHGNVLFTVHGPTALDFGGGPVIRDVNAIGFAAVKLDGGGQHVFTHALPLGATSASISAGSDGHTYVAGLQQVGMERRQYVHKLQPDGVIYKQIAFPSADPAAAVNVDERAACDGAGNLVVSQRFSEAGQSVLSYRSFTHVLEEQKRDRFQVGDSRQPFSHALTVGADLFVVATSQHGNNASNNAAAGDLRVEARSLQGAPVWTTRLGDARNEWPLGLAVRGGTLLVLSAASDNNEPQEARFTRLVARP